MTQPTQNLLMEDITVESADGLLVQILTTIAMACKLAKLATFEQAANLLLQYPQARQWFLETLFNLFDDDAPLDRLPAMAVPDTVTEALTQQNFSLGSLFDFAIKYGPMLIQLLGPLLKKGG